MPDIIFTRVYHSFEEEFGYLSKFGYIEISNGLCWLAAAARKSGYRTEIVDAFALKLDNEKLANLIAVRRPKYVGISACTMDIGSSADLAERLKKIDRRITIIVGGPHVTAVPDETMDRYPAFDIGVVGEGEETLIELLGVLDGKNSASISDVKGIIYRERNGGLSKTPPRAFLENLDSLPLPAWDLLPELKKYYFAPAWTGHSGNTTTITTSRGCPFQCIYCDRKVFGNRIRYHSAEYVLNMLKTLYQKYDVSHFRLGDDNFIINKERLFRICDLIIKEGLKISWSCLARADFIDIETLSRMKKAGCWSIAFGVETGSQEIHDVEKKGIRLEQIEEAVRLTKKEGIRVISFNIIGHPLETVETIKKTIAFNKRIRVDDFKTQFMTPFPGTELYRDAEKYGRLDRDWNKMGVFKDPVFIPYGITKEDMIKWNKIGFRSFYLQPRIIFSYLKNIRNIADIQIMAIGGLTVIAWKVRDLFKVPFLAKKHGR